MITKAGFGVAAPKGPMGEGKPTHLKGNTQFEGRVPVLFVVSIKGNMGQEQVIQPSTNGSSLCNEGCGTRGSP